MNHSLISSDVVFRTARPTDGPGLWRLVRDTGVLDLNSPYCYALMATDFGATCLVVEHGPRIIGAVIGYHPPTESSTLFCWQIAVHPDYQHQNLGLRMLTAWWQLPTNQTSQWVTATVAPDNPASQKLFTRFAQTMQAPIKWVPHFTADHFPDGHVDEPKARIGPIVISGEAP